MENEVSQHVETEVKKDLWFISGEYLSAAASMVAWQFIDGEEEYTDKDKFAEQAAYTLRQHCPLAYSYIFQNYQGEGALPQGTLQVILNEIRRHKPTFLGGLPNGGIIIPGR